ncbi:MAG: DUF4861 family protein [Chitinophagaceae bacterium]
MRTIFNFLLGVFIFPFSGYSQVIFEISNYLKVSRQEVVSILWKDVAETYLNIDTANFVIINSKTKQQLPFQLEYRGSKEIQNLLIQVRVEANSKLKLQLLTGKPEKFNSKTYSRYVPERKDDFAWENDKIAFRMYGKALEGTKENAYGTDVWVKRTDKLVINERYKRGEYHIDHGDGVDYYHVGFSLGAGNMAPYKNDTIWYSKNYRTWKVLDNGPLRSTFQLTFDEWQVASQKVKVVKTISVDAGSQMSRVEAVFTFDQTSPLPVVAGIKKRKAPGSSWMDESGGIMGYWEPTDNKYGTTGIGCLFEQPVQQMLMNKEHLLTVVQAISGQPIIYFHGAAWDKGGAITSSQKWFDYLKSYKEKIENPLSVVVRKAS